MHTRVRYTGFRDCPSTKPAVVMMMGAWEDGYRTGYNDAINQSRNLIPEPMRMRPMQTPQKKKRVGKKDPKMARALRKANAKARKKNGSFKKGYDQARVMREAHKIRRQEA
jgi:hypothetical protein